MDITLKGPMKDVLEYLVARPSGATYEQIFEELKLKDVGQARWLVGRLRDWSSNVSIRRVGKRGNVSVRAQYTPVTPEVTLKLGSNGSKEIDTLSGKTPSAKVSGGSRETDVVMPAAPTIPDVKTRYKFFEPPDFYKLLKSKVLVHGKNIALKGPPGIGKSSAFEYMAGSEFMPLVNINADAGLKSKHLIGSMTDNGRFEVAQFAAAVINGWWAKIDEANGMDPDAALALNSLLAPPYNITIHGKGYNVHPNFRLCITYNPGLVGTKPLPDSLKDRFYHIPVTFPTGARLTMMLKANGVDTSNADVLQTIQFAGAVAKLRNERRINYDITMRRLIDAWSDLIDGASLETALSNSVLGSIDSEKDKAEVAKLVSEYTKKGG